MGFRLRHNALQRQLWKLLSNPVAEVIALVALVLLALVTLVVVESRLIHSPDAPVVFSPK